MTEARNEAAWTEESLKALAMHKLPTLYDMILAQETLSVQVKKQNIALDKIRKELAQERNEEVETLCAEVDEKVEEIERLATLLAKEREVVIALIDSFYYLVKGIGDSILRIEEIDPEPSLFFKRESKWRPKLLEQTRSIVDAVDVTKGKMERYLQELEISLIIPKEGEPFSPSKQRAIDYCSGGTSGTVANVLRVGFQRGESVLRYADVTIYK